MGRIARIATLAIVAIIALLLSGCSDTLRPALYAKIEMEEQDPPVPGSGGVIAVGVIGAVSVDISWSAATDIVAQAEDLEYCTFYSTTSSLIDVNQVLVAGTPSGAWTPEMTSTKGVRLLCPRSALISVDFSVVYPEVRRCGRKDLVTSSISITVSDFISEILGEGVTEAIEHPRSDDKGSNRRNGGHDQGDRLGPTVIEKDVVIRRYQRGHRVRRQPSCQVGGDHVGRVKHRREEEPERQKIGHQVLDVPIVHVEGR